MERGGRFIWIVGGCLARVLESGHTAVTGTPPVIPYREIQCQCLFHIFISYR